MSEPDSQCGAAHNFVEWPEAPACTKAAGHDGQHANGCFTWDLSQPERAARFEQRIESAPQEWRDLFNAP